MTWSVKGVDIMARILAPSLAKAEAGLAHGGHPSPGRFATRVAEWSGLESHLKAHQWVMDREVLGDGVKCWAV